MVRILRFVLSGVCAGLAFIVAAELFYLREQNNSPLVEAATRFETPIETGETASDMEAIVAAILARPLFTPNRQPPQVLFSTSIEEMAEEPPRPLQQRLAGVT